MIPAENLYQPDKYKVILGEGIGIGFCTLWNEPKKIIAECPEILNKTAILGTLYSRQGVNIMIRNLALNPQIRKVYIWNNGALSCSPFGVSGKDILLALWKNGLNENNEVGGTDFKLEKEIERSVVELIIKNVSLEEVLDEDIKTVVSKLDDKNPGTYMSPVSFPEAVPEKIDIFPSEKVGFVARGGTVLEAWTRVVDRIMRYGSMKETQYGTKQRELIGVTWVIENEDPDKPNMDVDWPESLKQTIGLNNPAIDHYRSVFLSSDMPSGVKYTYGNRLMEYPGPDGPINQVDDVIVRELKEAVHTTRAIAITLVPHLDNGSKDQPCITQIQILHSGNKLHMLVTVRSHDIFKAGIPNAFGLRALQKSISGKAEIEMGSLQITSQSAHIYEAELSDAKKLMECVFWEREPATSFDPSIHSDPRGLFMISLENGEILAVFKTPTGEELLRIKGRTAHQVGMKIAQLEIASRQDHLLDIGMELQKAEIALDQGLAYTQDKPLPFDSKGGEDNICITC